ncbi:hypothetical protein JAAARDRAFT_28624 [Jaapia argillacea MUCL 33604]|uniref:A to I editase domain-containing protein n=1 Tax=Jaapia argillacea MUCL 33604 TaxID=933084 RepID=A0A067QDG0_9AGAM|nr:hypothetical protein JAAARDRAFT_28624 [Jaapia argillacea MUCL 33604]
MTTDAQLDVNSIVSTILSLYLSLNFNPPPNQFTVLASLILISPNTPPKVISLGTGSKCLPTSKFPLAGDALHDSHAEVLARRGAIRWFVEEVQRYAGTGSSDWIERVEGDKFDLKPHVKMYMYVSTVPCGDASTRYLASSQDPTMSTLKSSTPWAPLPPNTPSRGRDNYSLHGVLRTKPGRADSPPTVCMSCSDKIAMWGVMGIQGALASSFLNPVYVSGVIVGEVEEGLREVVREDCERAFWGRVDGVKGLPPPYHLHLPSIHFTSLPFIHSRSSLGPPTEPASSCNDSLCYIPDSPTKSQEVLIAGIRRGVPPKHRYKEKFRPILSKISLFNLYLQTIQTLNLPAPPPEQTYHTTKSLSTYQSTKNLLQTSPSIFSGWLRSGKRWESFDSAGRVIVVEEFQSDVLES